MHSQNIPRHLSESAARAELKWFKSGLCDKVHANLNMNMRRFVAQKPSLVLDSFLQISEIWLGK